MAKQQQQPIEEGDEIRQLAPDHVVLTGKQLKEYLEWYDNKKREEIDARLSDYGIYADGVSLNQVIKQVNSKIKEFAAEARSYEEYVKELEACKKDLEAMGEKEVI